MDYDVIVIGGGLAGAAISRSLAEAGRRVLVLERTRAFKDRVRGEILLPWGVAEARTLGIHDLLTSTCGREVRYFDVRPVHAPRMPPRDLVETTPARAGVLCFQHARMQQVLLDAAASAGAEVRRGVHVTGLAPGRRPAVSIDGTDGGTTDLAARMVIAADGRDSAMRRLAGFAERRDLEGTIVAGVMVAGLKAPDGIVTLSQDPGIGHLSVIAPLGDDRHRLYFCYHQRGPGPASPLTGERSWDDFRAASVGVGVPQEWFEGSRVAGPLASFDGADTWVDEPYSNGVALLGDAAAASDPAFGSGLSLTLRGVRLLRDQLLATDDWEAAGRAYAGEQQIHAASLRRITNWLTRLWFEPGPEADHLRAQALPRLGEDPTRMPDFAGLGCDAPSDENARRRLFGEA